MLNLIQHLSQTSLKEIPNRVRNDRETKRPSPAPGKRAPGSADSGRGDLAII